LSKVGLLRWLAALVAVTYHLRALLFAEYAQLRHKGPVLDLFYFLTSLGHETFVIYMVLSGLLLGGLSWKRWEERASDASADLWRTLAGLFLLLLPVLLVGGALDLAGSIALDGSGNYANHPQFAKSHLSLATLAGNLLLLQDMLVPGFGSNAMLFLLAYEWWAYLILTTFSQSRRGGIWRGLLTAAPIALGLGVLAPAFLGYFAAWLAGVAVACAGGLVKGKVPQPVGVAVFLGALLASRLSGSHLPGLSPGVVMAARVALDLLVALALALMLLSLYGMRPASSWPAAARAAKAQRWLVNLSLPVYAVHFPVMLFTVAAANSLLDLRLHAQPSPSGFAFFAVAVGVVYLFAYLLSALVGALHALLSRHSAVFAAQYLPVEAAADPPITAARSGRPGAGGPAQTNGTAHRAPPG
jgi:hypothetical protein